MKYDISVIIPARNEMFVSNTVADLIKNSRAKTEVIIVLDGLWANPGIPSHPDVRIVYLSESIGQRAATNLGAKLSKAKWIVKCDAHCAFDEGWDAKLLAVAKDHWTLVPALKNLHCFDWKCNKCGSRWYQGPTPYHCMIHEVKGKNGSKVIENPDCDSTDFVRKIIWQPNPQRPTSCSFCFDTTLHFQYYREFNKRPEGKGDITPTMSLQGSFFMLTRERYWSLNICDEKTGSWGQQGVEVAMKTWLSGGKVMSLHTTWYAHMFRTQGLDFGFPYPNSGHAQEHARQYSRDTWLNNKFEKQIYPLSWVLDKFAPLPFWDEASLTKVRAAGEVFYSTHPLTSRTNSFDRATGSLDDSSPTHVMPSTTEGSSSSGRVLGMSNEFDMSGVAALPVATNEMVEFQVAADRQRSNEPRINESMDSISLTVPSSKKETSIPGMVKSARPLPTPGDMVNVNIGEKSVDGMGIQGLYSKKLSHGSIVPKDMVASKGIIYYTDNQLPVKLAKYVQQQIKHSGLPIVSASLKPMDNMGKNIYLPLERGKLTYFKQILAALETSTSEVVFFCEHDVLYHQSHFQFTPPSKDKFYYNLNVWRIRPDGFAVTWEANQVAELCCYRELALEFYRNKLKEVEANQFNRSYEPGGRNKELYENWRSPSPNIDIRHGKNLTKSKWSINDFRDKSSCVNWQEITLDKIVGWDNLQSLIK